MNREEKRQYLLENGWWSHYHEDCWFESSKDDLYVEEGTGDIKGFRPMGEGVTLEDAFKILTKNKK
jgi:hypothetical protein|tara:strand:+ start:909 stop:1106 length:198 start_codon:yes stop_codon:yes gene_type:complete